MKRWAWFGALLILLSPGSAQNKAPDEGRKDTECHHSQTETLSPATVKPDTAKGKQQVTPNEAADGVPKGNGVVFPTPVPIQSRKDVWDKVLVVSTVAIVVVGVCQILFIWWTVQATKDNAKAAQDTIEMIKSKERARLLVSVPLEDDSFRFERLPAPTEIGGFHERIKLVVSQHGPTKAFNVVGKAAATIATSNALPAGETFRMESLPAIIDGDSEPISVYVNLWLGDGDLEGIADESRFAHLWGLITYEDVYGHPHRTPFRHLWDIGSSNLVEIVPARWIPWGSAEDNRAT